MASKTEWSKTFYFRKIIGDIIDYIIRLLFSIQDAWVSKIR